MAIKKENTTVTITLTPFHIKKLKIIKSITGLKNSEVIQRMIEQHNLFGVDEKDEE